MDIENYGTPNQNPAGRERDDEVLLRQFPGGIGRGGTDREGRAVGMARRGQERIPPATGETQKIRFERPRPTNLTRMRRGAEIPAVLVLHHADLAPADLEEREGFRVTRPMRTILDLVAARGLSSDLLKQAFDEARNRGLITAREAQSDKLTAWLTSEKMGRR